MPRAALHAALLTTLFFSGAAHLGAQEAQNALEVRGRFLADPGGTPLAGAYVSLLDARGAVAAATLTNGSGWFSLRAAQGGRYTIRAENIGYTTAETVVELPGASPVILDLRATFQAIELEGITAEVDKACSLPTSTATRLATLWDEVRKAFRVTAFVESESMVLFDVDRWTRTLEPDRLRVQQEQRRPRTGLHPGSPFVSLAPERLAADGYVQGDAEAEEIRYYGPDAKVLLDRSFQDTHCFGFTNKGPEDGWVGLRFRPRDQHAADIEGTLWIDGPTYAPRRLEYRYAKLPWPLLTDKVGGRIDFTRIPEGPWIIERWWIRMPVVQESAFRMGSNGSRERRYSLGAVIEEGGEVRRARTNDQEVLTFAMGTIDGVVVDSVSGEPVGGARVGVVGTFFQATTDGFGRFRFTDVPRGRYAVSGITESLASVSPELRSAEADVTADAITKVRIRLPSPEAVAAGSCGEPITENGPAVIAGTLRGLDGAVVAGATVEVSWQEVRGGATGLSGRTRVATVPVRDDGTFAVCGVPLDEELTVRGTAPALRGEPAVFRFEDDVFRSLDLIVAPADLAEAIFVDVVGPKGNDPVEGATITLPGLGRSITTDARGRAVFPKVPVGPLAMKVEHAAYLARVDTVDVGAGGQTTATVRLTDRTFELEPVTVTVMTPEMRAERARGSSATIKLGAPQIAEIVREKGARNVAEIVRRALPSGVRITPLVVGMNYVGTCIESSRGGMIARKLRSGGMGACAMVQVVVDGSYLTEDEAARLVENFPLTDIVSIEFLSPIEQTFRHGAGSGNGMLVITTARR